VARALVIVDHGSRRPEAHHHLDWIAEQVRQRAPELRVYVAHMELAEPSVESAIETSARDGATEIIVHPLFLVPGRHMVEDIPQLVRRAAARHPELEIRISEALGSVPELADLILQTL
jgi:sirohydrochlorin ferrochelatase